MGSARDAFGRRWAGAAGALRLMSYNLLHPHHASPARFPHLAPAELAWEARVAKLHAELALYAPDVLCLQEAVPDLALAGFAQHFEQKSAAEREGVAVCFRPERFEPLARLALRFRPARDWPPGHALHALLERSDVAVLSVLRARDGGTLCVASAHLPFSERHNWAKFGMATLLLRAALAARARFGPLDLFLCGDFNALPCSMLYGYLARGALDAAAPAARVSEQAVCAHLSRLGDLARNARETRRAYVPAAGADNARVLADLAALELEVDWTRGEARPCVGPAPPSPAAALDALARTAGLRSAYARGAGAEAEGFPTQFARGLQTTVDYIWHGGAGFRLAALLELPPADLLRRTGPLPAGPFCSDHLALAADFARAA